MLEWKESGNLVWNIDASLAVHMDLNSHTGYYLTLGNGSPISGLKTQGLNTRSSAELELVRVDDAIEFIEWVCCFLKFQVDKYLANHPLKELGTKNLVEQDTTSAIKFARGGQTVYGKRTRNNDIRYFYIN